MCGLVGILTKRTNGFFSAEADAFQQMLYADAVRGHDATGVFGVTKEGNVDIKKQAAAASIFVSSTEFSSFKAKIVPAYRDWETDRKSTRLNSSHSAKSRMPSSA